MTKRCKLCGGEPKWVYYCIPEVDYPEGWDLFDDDDRTSPMFLFKRLECKNCKATTLHLNMLINEAEKSWNEGKLVQYWGEEKVYDVEKVVDE